MILDGIDYGEGYTKATKWHKHAEWFDDEDNTWNQARAGFLEADLIYRRPMTQAEKDAEAKPLTTDDLVQSVCKAMLDGEAKYALTSETATRIIAIVREHDAKAKA
jgi:hypothetical protein